MCATSEDPSCRKESAATLVSTGTIEVVPGGITRQQVDIIVTAANESLPVVDGIRLVAFDRETYAVLARSM